MIFEQYIGELIVAIGSAATTWLISRKKQKVDTKKIEIEILEKSLQILNKDVVEPLQDRLVLLQNDYTSLNKNLKRLQDAINKMYNCRLLPSCPIRAELQKQENSVRKGNNRKQPTNRQREPVCRADDEANKNTSDTGDPDAEH